LSIPKTFEHVADALNALGDAEKEEFGVRADFLDALKSEGEEVTKEIQSLEEQLPELKRRLDGLWVEKKDYEYELVAVFMHRGESLI
jgi:ubiquitin carboxyl-terminal hydrolase 25/28